MLSWRLLLTCLLPACAPTTPDLGGSPDAGRKDTGDRVDTDDTDDTDLPEDTDDTDIPDDTDTGPLPVLVGDATVAILTNNPNGALVTVTLDRDADVWVEYGQALPSASVTPTRTVVAGTPTTLLVLGLKSGLSYELRVHAESADAAPWESEALPLDVPALQSGFQRCNATTYADRHDPDEVYCTNGTHAGGYTYFCVDHLGDVVYQIASAPAELTYSTQPLSTGGWASVSTSNSVLLMFDEQSELIGQFTPGYFAGRTTYEHQYIDNHEVIEIAEGEWAGALAFITSSWEYSPYGWVYVQGIIVFDPSAREVLWDWSMAGDLNDGVPNDPLLDYNRTAYGGYNQDFGHGNSLVHRLDPDGREVFWMSLRSQDWVVKIDVAEAHIVWRFGLGGDFALVEDMTAGAPVSRPAQDWFFGQHAIELRSSSGSETQFTLFDNGYYREDDSGAYTSAYSRIVEYRLDEDTLLAEQVFSYGPADPYDSEYLYAWGMGDAEVLPDEARVAWSSGYGVGYGYGGPFLREVSYPDGELLWSLDCFDYGSGFYRFNWFPSLYELDWRIGG